MKDVESSVAEALEYFEQSGLGRIRRFDDSNVYKLDQFIKLWMDAMKGHCFVIHYYGGSLLRALEGIVSGIPQDAFRSAVLERVRDDIRLRDVFREKGPGYVAAGHALRKRGLLG